MKTWNKALLMGMMVIAGYAAGGVASASGKSQRVRGANPSTETVAAGKTPQSTRPPLNACGCYAVDNACVCTSRILKCDCPGDCEPVGCEAKRQKEIDRQLAEETKRIRDEARKRDEAERVKQTTATPDDDEEADDGSAPAADAPVKGKTGKAAAKRNEKSADKPGAKAGDRAAKSKVSPVHAPG